MFYAKRKLLNLEESLPIWPDLNLRNKFPKLHPYRTSPCPSSPPLFHLPPLTSLLLLHLPPPPLQVSFVENSLIQLYFLCFRSLNFKHIGKFWERMFFLLPSFFVSFEEKKEDKHELNVKMAATITARRFTWL